MKDNMKNKRGQVTIFIILAIVLIGVIVLLFAIIPSWKSVLPGVSSIDDPRTYISDCMKIALSASEKNIISHGGFLETTLNLGMNPKDYLMFDSKKVVMICYTDKEKENCINMHPALNSEVRKEILKDITPAVGKCFANLKSDLNKYDYKEDALNLEVEIIAEAVTVKAIKKIEYTKNDNTVVIESFSTKINSPLYEFVRFTEEIVNEEVDCNCRSETCNADLIKLNKNNRDFEILKPAYSGRGEEVYSIKEVATEKMFYFAIKNCVRFPAT